jgi:ubiquinone/menaquinone biosynthesis C-methylase UbiE
MASDFFDNNTAVYSKFHAWFYETLVAPAVYPSRWIIDQRFLDHLPEGAQILDVGCGGGLFTGYMAEQRPDIQITGLDLSPPQIERARKATQPFGSRVSFTLGSALELPFPDASFDGVISYGSIKHWPSWEAGALECWRVLRPGGPLLITDAERGARWDDCVEFVKHYNAPKFMFKWNLALFRTWVAGRSLDLDDVRRVAALLELDDKQLGRIEHSALFQISGIRPAARPSA